MPPLPTDSPFRATRDERRASLSLLFLPQMEDLLIGQRYSDLSIDRLAAAVKISRASFYRYFDDKGDLLLQMLGHVSDDLLGAGDAWWNLPRTATKDELRNAHRAIVGVYRRHRLVLRTVVEVSGYDEDVHAVFEELVSNSVDQVAAHISLGQQEGFIAPHLDARATAELLVYMGERSLYRIIGIANETRDARYPDPLAEIYWRTLYEGYRDPSIGSKNGP
ncbi:MAG: TetR/AcrR family transcriptional regulator, ethionamide resistance regulator [Solirubrobacteraceae bacterium]|nr:TetR/AcrR family transcriptional regulator, ethionamide resistance regulator [Solirubrobacteraceae bacterium]